MIEVLATGAAVILIVVVAVFTIVFTVCAALFCMVHAVNFLDRKGWMP